MAVQGADRVVGEAGKAVVKGTSGKAMTGHAAKMLVRNAITEGVWEEMGQGSVSQAAKYYAQDRTFTGYSHNEEENERVRGI